VTGPLVGISVKAGNLTRDIRVLGEGPDPTVQATSSGNLFLSWLHLSDSDGGLVDHYKLFLDPSLFNPIHAIYAGVCKFLHMTFMILGGYATAGIEWVTNPDKMVKPIGDAYQSLASRVFQIAPPQALVAATFSILVVSVFFHQTPGSNNRNRMTKAHWNRLASGFSVMVIVLALAANPFRIVRWMLSLVSTFSGYLTGTDSDTLYKQMVTNNTDRFLKPMTQLITYHDVLSPDCSQLWSQGVNSSVTPRCVTAVQRADTDPDELTVLLAILAVVIAVCFGYFAYVGLKLFFRHTLLSVFYGTGVMYVGVVSLAQRRAYDPLIKNVAKAGAHFLLALAMVLVISVIPTWIVGVAHSTTWIPLWLQFVILGAGYVITARIMERIGDKDNAEKLSEVLKGKTKQSVWFNALYPNDPKLRGDSVVGSMLTPGTAWVSEQYSSGKKKVKQWWVGSQTNGAAQNASGSTAVTAAAATDNSSRSGKGGDVSGAVQNTPQSDAAIETVSFPDEPASTAMSTAMVVQNRGEPEVATVSSGPNGEGPIYAEEVWSYVDPYRGMSAVAATSDDGSRVPVTIAGKETLSGHGGVYRDPEGHAAFIESRGGIPYLDRLTDEQIWVFGELVSGGRSGHMVPPEPSDGVEVFSRTDNQVGKSLQRWRSLEDKWEDTFRRETAALSGELSPVDVAISGQVDFSPLALEAVRGDYTSSWASKDRYDRLSDVAPSREEYASDISDLDILDTPSTVFPGDMLSASGDMTHAVHDARVLTALTGREHRPDERKLTRVFVCSTAGNGGNNDIYLSTRTGFGDYVG
jgi:hypothetical protein